MQIDTHKQLIIDAPFAEPIRFKFLYSRDAHRVKHLLNQWFFEANIRFLMCFTLAGKEIIVRKFPLETDIKEILAAHYGELSVEEMNQLIHLKLCSKSESRHMRF